MTAPVAPDTVTLFPAIIDVTIPVIFVPLIAAAVPVNLDALSVVILLAGTVPLFKLLAFRLPLNEVEVTTPAALILLKTHVPVVSIPAILPPPPPPLALIVTAPVAPDTVTLFPATIDVTIPANKFVPSPIKL